MNEDFISIALDAFQNANGDIDKFELYLRRNAMTIPIQAPGIVNSLPTSDQINLTPEMAEELAQLDLDNMTDTEILKYAQKLGLSI